jgi:hypothetical protein
VANGAVHRAVDRQVMPYTMQYINNWYINSAMKDDKLSKRKIRSYEW